jgi:aminoglycoside phosphotransferase (APT) family kinase protein
MTSAAGSAGLPAGQALPAGRTLTAWLTARLAADGSTQVTSVEVTPPARAGVGQSSETWLFEARWSQGGKGRTADLVLRKQPGYDGIFLRPDAGREFEVIRGLEQDPAVPVPRTRWVERDPGVLGVPFFVMDRVPGIVPSGRPSIHATGWLTTLTPSQRQTVWQSSLDAIAALHEVPWPRSHAFLACDDAAPGLAGYLRHMAEWYHWTTVGRRFPVTDAALAYALEGAPGATTSPPVLAWVDARPGNIIFDPDRCVPAALIDWEVATLAPPEVDIAQWLIFDDFATSAAGVERLSGYATREEILSRYESVSGRRLGDIGYFEIVQGLFMATTLIRQADAHVRGGRLAPGTRMGYGNSMTQMLARRLGLALPELSEDYLLHRSGRLRPAVSLEPAGPAPRRQGTATSTSKAG